MNPSIAMRRRDVFIAGGASLAINLVEMATAKAQTQASYVVSSVGPAISPPRLTDISMSMFGVSPARDAA
jgi:hypothetical protein